MVRSKVRPSSRNPIDDSVQGNAHTPYQPSVGPTRTMPMPRGRSEPFERHRPGPGRHANAEAGPSTFAAPLDPHLELPPGGISEPTANAEQKQIITEEEETPVSDFYCSQSPSCNHMFIRRQAPRKTKRQRNDEWRGQSEDDSTSCAPGSGSERTLRGVRPSTGPWPVRPYPISTKKRLRYRSDLFVIQSRSGLSGGLGR